MSSSSLANKPTVPQAGFDIPVELQLLDAAQRAVRARIRRVSPSIFELSCPDQLPVGQRLAVTHEGRRIEVTISEVRALESGMYQLTAQVATDDLGEVRSELRIPTALTGLLTVAGKREEFPVHVLDMSPSGMGLESPVSVPSGVKVCINLDQGLAFGEIRYCREKTPDTFIIGFRLEQYIGHESSDR